MTVAEHCGDRNGAREAGMGFDGNPRQVYVTLRAGTGEPPQRVVGWVFSYTAVVIGNEAIGGSMDIRYRVLTAAAAACLLAGAVWAQQPPAPGAPAPGGA